MAYPLSVKRSARELRALGYSYREISERLHIGKGTVYAWTERVQLNRAAQARLEKVMTLAQRRAAASNTRRRKKWLTHVERNVDSTIENININRSFFKVLASTLYWAEGGKHNKHYLDFTNSDSQMISCYLQALRKGFPIRESKLRALVHIHEYHNDDNVKRYWSRITDIPLSQFTKSYKKPHTGKRKKEGYMGCIHIGYGDTRIAAEVRMIYNRLPERIGGVG